MDTPKMKFRFGNYEGWLMGKMNWAVVDRRTQEVVGMATSMGQASTIAQRLYNIDRSAGV